MSAYNPLYLPGEANKWHEITFDLSKNTAWNGNIRALWLDVANYWEIQEDNPGKIEYDYIRFYRKGDNRLNYDANISLAADVSGNAEVTVTNMPENESNVPTGSGYLVSKVVPVASDSSIYFAGWSSSKTSTALVDEGNVCRRRYDTICCMETQSGQQSRFSVYKPTSRRDTESFRRFMERHCSKQTDEYGF